MPPIRIGKLARMANVNVQTLRFYERKGLLPRPTRRPSGYREYPPQAIGIVKLIKHVQGLGFSLKEIKEFLLLRNKPSTTMAATCGGLERKIEEIDSRITELAAIRHTLAKMLEIHRQGGDALFAPAFDRHLERLVSEAMTGESDERSSQRRSTIARRRAKSARAT